MKKRGKRINEVIVKDAYTLPRIDDILNTLSGARYHYTLDASSGYYQIPVAEEDIPKTAFQTISGLYKFVRMPLLDYRTPQQLPKSNRPNI